MESKKITQAKIAKLLNCTQPTVSKYKKGLIKLGFLQALKLKSFLNWTDDDIKSFITNNDTNNEETNLGLKEKKTNENGS